MNRILSFITVFILTFISCEEGFLTNCNECYIDGPEEVKLEISLSNTSGTTLKTVTLYEGALEDNLILFSFPFYETEVEVDALLYKDYTVTATYNINGQQYIAVDEACPQLRYDETVCEEACYYVYGNTVDLRLRYTGK